MKNKKIIIIFVAVILSIILAFSITNIVLKNMEKKESILATIDHLEKYYGDGDFVVIESVKEKNIFTNSVESKYTDTLIEVKYNKDNESIEENFIDIYGLEKFDLKNYGNVSEYIYMTEIETLNKIINKKLDATITYQTMGFKENYGFGKEGRLPTTKDFENALILTQPSIKFKKAVNSEQELLEEIKKAIKLLKVDLKDNNIGYDKKIILYSFNNSNLESINSVDNGYIWIEDYDKEDYIRINILDKDIKINKNEL